MKPVFLAALAAAALSAVAALVPPSAPRVQRAAEAPDLPPSARLESRCPPGSLPDSNVCVPVPRPEQTAAPSRATGSEGIPRRPDRPKDYAALEWPIGAALQSDSITESTSTSGLPDLPPERRGLVLRPPKSTDLLGFTLDEQSGKTEVLYAGELVGNTLVTLHRVPHAERERRYVTLLGRLPHLLNVKAGSSFEPGKPLMKLTAGSQLYLETRLIRDSVKEPGELPVEQLLRDANSVWVDPRNVMPLQGTAKD